MQHDERHPGSDRPEGDEERDQPSSGEAGTGAYPPDSEDWFTGTERDTGDAASPEPSGDRSSDRGSMPAADEAPSSATASGWPQEERAAEPPPSEVEAYPADTSATGEGDDAAAAPPAEGSDADATAAQAVPPAAGAVGESTQCPRCGTENRPGLSFCRNCGQRLVAAGVATTVERPSAPEGTMACPRCGTHNPAGVGFCRNCGANLRGMTAGHTPPPADEPAVEQRAEERAERHTAVLGPVVLLIGVVGLITAYLLPFEYGSGSLYQRAMGPDGYGAAFWAGYPDVAATPADQAYFGMAAPIPLLAILLVGLAVAGLVRARPGMLQSVGLGVALLWSVGLAVLFIVVELLGELGGDMVAILGGLSPAGIIFFLSALIVVIGTLTRFARS